LKYFDDITKGHLISAQYYRFLIFDGYEFHIHINFIEYCISHWIVAYCLPSHTTYLLQPLNVGEVHRLTRFGNVAINKGNFLRLCQSMNSSIHKEQYSRSMEG